MKVADIAFGWCWTCNAQVGDWPLLGLWSANKSIWLHEYGCGHKVQRVSHDEAWEMVKAAQEDNQ